MHSETILRSSRGPSSQGLPRTRGCHGPSVTKDVSGTLASLRKKCEPFVMPEVDASAPPATVADGTTKVMAAFQSKQMSWADTFDSNPVPGLGKVGRAKLMERDGFIRFKQSPLFVDFMKEVRGAQRELSLSKWTARFTDCARLPRTCARLCPCEIEARTRGGRKFGGGRPPLGPLVTSVARS